MPTCLLGKSFQVTIAMAREHQFSCTLINSRYYFVFFFKNVIDLAGEKQYLILIYMFLLGRTHLQILIGNSYLFCEFPVISTAGVCCPFLDD